jgi:hypothetical protein
VFAPACAEVAIHIKSSILDFSCIATPLIASIGMSGNHSQNIIAYQTTLAIIQATEMSYRSGAKY